MANDVQYRTLRTSDDSTEDEEEPYLRCEARLFRFAKDRFFNSKCSVKWPGISAAFLYMLSAILILATLRFPTQRQCTRKMSTWCKPPPSEHLANPQSNSCQAPMIEVVEYEWQMWDVTSPSKYTGSPTREIEMEWDYLWQCKSSK
jgi:hypothetical protein